MNSNTWSHNCVCNNCKTPHNLTRHHLKVKNNTKNGEKTGEIEILCRDCHDKIEAEYNKKGIISTNFMSKKLKPINLYMYGIFQMRNPLNRNKFLRKIKYKKYEKRHHQAMCLQALKMKEILEWKITNKHENTLINNLT